MIIEELLINTALSFFVGILASNTSGRMLVKEKNALESIQKSEININHYKKYIYEKSSIKNLFKDIEKIIHDSHFFKKNIWITDKLDECGVFLLHEKIIYTTDICNKNELTIELNKLLRNSISNLLTNKNDIDHFVDLYHGIIDVKISENQNLHNKISRRQLLRIENLVEKILYPNVDSKNTNEELFDLWKDTQIEFSNKKLENSIVSNNYKFISDENLLKDFSVFIERDWSEIVKNKYITIKDKYNSLNEIYLYNIFNLFNDHDKINWKSKVSTLKRNLTKTINRESINIISEINTKKRILFENKSKESLEILNNYHKNIVDYFDFCTSSSFEKCFCIYGSTGSGKSRFLLSLMSGEIDLNFEFNCEEIYYLPIEILNRDTIFENIDFSIKKFLNKNDINTQNVLNYFVDNRHKSYLVIVIDDAGLKSMHDDNFSDNLEKAIENLSGYRNIKWIISLKDQLYYTDQKEWRIIEKFTNYYKTISNNCLLNGMWYHFDKINIQNETGLKIIGNELKINENEIKIKNLLKYNTNYTVEHSYKLLCNPLVSNIILLSKSKYEIVNLSLLTDIIFLQKINDVILNIIDKKHYGFTDHGIDSIIQVLAEEKISQIPKNEFYQKIYLSSAYTDLHDIGESKQFCNKLIYNNLLSIRYDKLIHNFLIKISFIPFWSYRIAHKIIHSASDLNTQNAKLLNNTNYLFISDDEFIQDSIITTILLHFDCFEETFSKNCAWRIWINAIENINISNSAIFFALSKVNNWIQNKVVNKIYYENIDITNKKEFYALLHFLSCSSLSENCIVKAINLISRYYTLISDYNLIEYFKFVLEHLFESITNIDLLKNILISLNGSEVLGDNGDIAGLFLEKLKILFDNDPDEILHFIINNIDAVDFKDKEQEYYDNIKLIYNKSFVRLFRDWLFVKILCFIIEEYGSNAFDIIINCNWFVSNRTFAHKRLINRMEKEATLAFGFYFRLNKKIKSNQHNYNSHFISIVKEYSLSEDVNKRRIAFYLIKHSVPFNAIDSRVIEKDLQGSFYHLHRTKSNNKFITSIKENNYFCSKQHELILNQSI